MAWRLFVKPVVFGVLASACGGATEANSNAAATQQPGGDPAAGDAAGGDPAAGDAAEGDPVGAEPVGGPPEGRWGAAAGSWLLFDSDAKAGTRDSYVAQIGSETVLWIAGMWTHQPAASADGASVAMIREMTAEIITFGDDTLGYYPIEMGGAYPVWAPGGEAIAYVAQGDAYILNLQERTNTPVGLEAEGIGATTHVQFLPEGQSLIVSRGTEIGVVDLQGQGFRAIVEAGRVPVALSDISPDGSRIAFDAECTDGVGVRAAMVAETTAACDAPLLSPPGVAARRGTIGPEGSLAFEVGEPGAKGEIWVVPSPGAAAVQLTTGAGDHRNPQFTPATFVEPEFLSGGPPTSPMVSP